MSGARVERRLAAIPAADAASCSRLMGEDNAGTLVRLAGVAHAMCDVSNKLVADLGHTCDASGMGVVIDVTALPLSPPASRIIADAGEPGNEVRVFRIDAGRRRRQRQRRHTDYDAQLRGVTNTAEIDELVRDIAHRMRDACELHQRAGVILTHMP